ncbi:2,3-diphosphoglycerate-dependent phosphoglycerate mutase [Listeria monocytogenes]|nr:2,3-diphosphoglycerate-dependent phosphoglycerate mutase [Listeria monocytogenes]
MKLILIRHGESKANKENIFTGWLDVDLSVNGEKEAHNAGKKLKNLDISIDKVYTSVLKRAIKTTNIILDESDNSYLPVIKNWRLNERHYGALQGLNKTETAQKYGTEQVQIWRRSYKTRPPFSANSSFDKKYSNLDSKLLPRGESLCDTLQRVIPMWQDQLALDIKNGQNVLIVAHGNSLRALIKYIEEIGDEEITHLNIPTGEIIIYDLDESLKLINKEIY